MKKPKMQLVSTFQVDSETGNYLVSLEQIKNNKYGNPRFKATIVDLNNWCLCAWLYTFTGHYLGGNGEAEWVVKHHEKMIANA